jgi:hypothetical protein
MSKKAKFYKGRYLIAFYDLRTDDQLLGVADNSREAAKMLGLSLPVAQSEIGRVINGLHAYIRFGSDRAVPHLIDMGAGR